MLTTISAPRKSATSDYDFLYEKMLRPLKRKNMNLTFDEVFGVAGDPKSIIKMSDNVRRSFYCPNYEFPF